MSLLFLFNADVGDASNVVKFDESVYQQTVLQRREKTNYEAIREFSEQKEEAKTVSSPSLEIETLPPSESYIPFEQEELPQYESRAQEILDIKFPDIKILPPPAPEADFIPIPTYESQEIDLSEQIRQEEIKQKLKKLKQEQEAIIALMLMEEL